MPARNLAWLLIMPILVLFLSTLTAVAPPPKNDYDLVRNVVDVLAEVDKNYYRELTADEKKKLVEAMLRGGLRDLDRHGDFYNEESMKQFDRDTDGKYGGIGAVLTIDTDTNQLMIESTLHGTPAYRAGLQPGDLITHVGGTATKSDKPLDSAESRAEKIREFRKLIIGDPGTDVQLTVHRVDAKEPETITVTREIVHTYPVRGFSRKKEDPSKWEYIADEKNKIAVVRISAFNKDTDKEVKAAVLEAEKAGAKALVIDLRDNGGGLLDQAVSLSDMFLNEGVILTTKDRTGNGREWTAKKSDTIFEPAAKRPIAILVNGYSASASEILAAALADNARAVIVGERSYGKGSVQKVLPLSNGKDHIKLTTEMWYTPKGKHINRNNDAQTDWGVSPSPELEVKLTPEEVRQFQLYIASLDYVKGKADPKKEGIQKALSKLDPNYKDKVMEKALEYLRKKLSEVE